MHKDKTFQFEPILLLIFCLCFQSSLYAQTDVGIIDTVIGSTFKVLVKSFILTVDIEKFKKENIDRLNKMDEEKFQKRYARAYEIVKHLPSHLKAVYGVSEHMTKKQAIKNIGLLDKKKMYQIIDVMPDAVIADQFKQYLNKTKQQITKSNLVEQINKFRNKIIEKIEPK